MYKYTSPNGEFIQNIPARDLSNEEVEGFDPDTKKLFAIAIQKGIYKRDSEDKQNEQKTKSG